MSLESKAKSYEEVYALWKEAWKKTVDGVHNPLLDQKWVRLETCQKTVSVYEEQVFKLAVEKAELKKRLEKLPQTIDEIAERVRRKLDLTRSSGAAVFDVAISMLKDELEKAESAESESLCSGNSAMTTAKEIFRRDRTQSRESSGKNSKKKRKKRTRLEIAKAIFEALFQAEKQGKSTGGF